VTAPHRARAPVRKRRAPWVLRLAAAVARPLVWCAAGTSWSGEQHLPAEGSFIVASSHVSAIDPVVVGCHLEAHNAPPRFLAKHSLFEVPVLGRLLRAGEQIPVYRQSRRAADSLVEAREALQEGHCVVVFPEGTFTRDPQLWPMAGRSGVGRLALQTRRPVVPVGHWGAHRLLPPGARLPRLRPRAHIRVRAGAPVDLSDLYGRTDPAAVREATDRVMDAVTAIVAELRGESPPPTPLDPRQ